MAEICQDGLHFPISFILHKMYLDCHQFFGLFLQMWEWQRNAYCTLHIVNITFHKFSVGKNNCRKHSKVHQHKTNLLISFTASFSFVIKYAVYWSKTHCLHPLFMDVLMEFNFSLNGTERYLRRHCGISPCHVPFASHVAIPGEDNWYPSKQL